MRARLAIAHCQLTVELREVVLKQKPIQLSVISPKATVPVLQLSPTAVIDESLDIMLWALRLDPENSWLMAEDQQLALIHRFDTMFKPWLDKYKYADRHVEQSQIFYRQQCSKLLLDFELGLNDRHYLYSDEMSLVDAALFPFIRQFAHVDRSWFYQSEFPQLQKWLTCIIDSRLFKSIMRKYGAWETGQTQQLFGNYSP
jgi:glutathione S-transferase